VKHHEAIQHLLHTRLTEAKARNSALSIRAFSRRLGLSPSMLSRVLSGQRTVSRSQAERIAQALLLPPDEPGDAGPGSRIQ